MCVVYPLKKSEVVYCTVELKSYSWQLSFIMLIVFVLYCFGSYPILVMGVVPSLMGNVCVYVCM